MNKYRFKALIKILIRGIINSWIESNNYEIDYLDMLRTALYTIDCNGYDKENWYTLAYLGTTKLYDSDYEHGIPLLRKALNELNNLGE